MISKNLVDLVEEVIIDSDVRFPSDHAPISITMTFPEKCAQSETLLLSAENLGAHAVAVAKVPDCIRIVPL